MIELYHNDMSTCAQKVRCQLAHKDLEWTSREVDLRAGDQNTPAFRALNPAGVVPVLVHDGEAVRESNIIMEYLEDVFPDRMPLRPAPPAARADMRMWLQRLDVGLHQDIVPISAVAFRVQILAMNKTPEAMEAFFAAMPDPKVRAVRRELIEKGAQSAPFKGAFDAWVKAVETAEQALASRQYLSADDITLADFAILPYALRLEQMQLAAIWADKPNFAGWLGRMKDTKGFRIGIEQWLNPKYLTLMQAEGSKIDVAGLLAA